MNDKVWELLSAYFSGNISDVDRRIVENWITDSDENARIFAEAQKIWESTGLRLQYKNIDSGQLLAEFKKRISKGQTPITRVVSIFRPHTRYLRVAAAICLLAVSYFVIRNAIRRDISVETYDEVATFYLPDSSKVWLNVNSKLTYPKRFGNRSVQLHGEAFFSVKKDTSAFIVSTLTTRTKVLGTAFNINESDSIVTLSVAEGRVEFSNRDSIQSQQVIVRAKEQAVLETQIKKSINSDPDFAKWREQNNPAYEREKTSPEDYLIIKYTWRKNQINQTVIEGTIKNNASLASYQKIVLAVTYTKPDGNTASVEFILADQVKPNHNLKFRRRLLDILSDTQAVVIKIKSAGSTTKNSY